MQPLMFVLLFAYVFGGAIDVGGSYREYIVGGILVQTLGFAMVGPAITIATDFTQGVLDRFRALPVHRSSYLVGHFLSELAGLLLSATILLGAGLIVGWRVHTDLPHVLGGFGVLVLLAATMVWVGTWLGLLVRSPDAVMGVAFTVIFPVTFLSNAFVPLDSLPSALQWIAAWNPFTAIAGAIRELFGNPASPVSRTTWLTDNPVLASVLILSTVLAVAVTGSLRRYRARTTD
jgi:ABC transporter DrrB family efflux protein